MVENKEKNFKNNTQEYDIMDNKNNPQEPINLEALEKAYNFNITPCEDEIDIKDSSQYNKLELSDAQKIHINAFLQQLPAAAAAGRMSQMYTLTFPEGLPHTLMQLKNGGLSTSIIGADGKIAGVASLYSAMAEAAIFGTFTVMSVVTGQFFLFQINKELKKINQCLDEIIEFLYGEKKAELISEVNFTKCAYENYASVMGCEEQRIATISGLQQAGKVAIKDVEFYMSDLENKVKSTRDNKEIVCNIEACYQIKDCLELSIQLYVMSGLLEIYYAQNYDRKYINYIEKEMCNYIGKSENRILSNFSKLQVIVSNAKAANFKNKHKHIVKDQVDKTVESLKNAGISSMCKSLQSALNLAAKNKKTEYYLRRNGDVYSKV